jgi:hypothetical protein
MPLLNYGALQNTDSGGLFAGKRVSIEPAACWSLFAGPLCTTIRVATGQE